MVLWLGMREVDRDDSLRSYPSPRQGPFFARRLLPPDAADCAADYYRIDIDDAVVLDVLDRAAALAPGDSIFADARRVAAGWRGR